MQIRGHVINQSKMEKLKNMQDAKLFAMTDMTFGKVITNLSQYVTLLLFIIVVYI